MFYYLKGGRVDFGEEHSIIYGHSQFGRTYEQGWRKKIIHDFVVQIIFFFVMNTMII